MRALGSPVGEWVGSVRDRLLWAVLDETGLRLGEALGLQHRDWHTGRGDTPYVEVVPREHPHGLRVKGGAYRKLYVSDRAGPALRRVPVSAVRRRRRRGFDDIDAACVFVNLAGEPLFVADAAGERLLRWCARLRRDSLSTRCPAGWTPHWFRHTHATALLLAGVPLHVVARRLGHADVQTTLNLYAWVSDDAELRALADWQRLTRKLGAPCC